MKSNIIIISVLLVILLAFGLYISNIQTNVHTKTPQAIKRYTDPGNHYSITIPSDWTENSDYGSQQTGIGTANEKTTRIEIANLTSGEVGLNISVYESAPVCDNEYKTNTILAGFPAYYNQMHYSWTIKTTSSTIVIGYYYPGLNIFRGKPNTPLVQQSDMEANQQIINSLISTLKLQATTPLNCQ